MSDIRVVVADDQALVRMGLCTLIGATPGMVVVAEADDGAEAVRCAEEHRPDVILMDVRMPVMDGLEATRRICADLDLAGVRVVILTTFDVDDYVFQALRAGATGFLLKDSEPDEIVRAVRVAADGDALLAPSVTRRLIGDYARRPAAGHYAPEMLDGLTEREREIVALVSRGLTNQEIAERLVVSPLTVKTHVSNILSKAGARDRTQLVVLAYESGLVQPGEPASADP
jgi:DNA-binding NarL/FixJ family response regulator